MLRRCHGGMSANRRVLSAPADIRTAALGMVALALLLVFGLALLWSRHDGGERSALVGLDSTDRQALYEKTLSAFVALCNERTPPRQLEARCREEAALLEDFPECDSRCVETLGRWAPSPSR
jgi:hypothetical protein